MRALVLQDGKPQLIDKPRPVPRDDQVLVRMTMAGICNTDLELVRGYMNFAGTLGHELLGVAETGDLRGQRVTCEINFACGKCDWCRRQQPRHCPTRSVLGILEQDGAFADFVVAPRANLHVVPDGVDDLQAVFTEPLAAAFEVLEQVHIQPRDEVVVLGDGKLGLLLAQVIALTGARVLCVGKHDDHLAIARQAGAQTVLFDQWDRTKRDVVIEATGTASGFELAVAATRPGGTVVLKSTVADKASLSLAALVIDEIHVVGSRCGPFAPALRALADGHIDVGAMVGGCFDLSQALDGLDAAAERGALKIVLRA